MKSKNQGSDAFATKLVSAPGKRTTLSNDSGNCAGKIYNRHTVLRIPFDMLDGITAIQGEEKYTLWIFW